MPAPVNASRGAEDSLEVITRVRSATLSLGSDQTAPFSRAWTSRGRIDVPAARVETDDLTRAIFFAERAATPPLSARARVIWRGWAERFGRDIVWETTAGRETTPRVRDGLGELGVLLSGPATRGELRALDAYEALFVHLFSLGWALAEAASPVRQTTQLDDASGTGLAVLASVEEAWLKLKTLWEEPWLARRRLDDTFTALERASRGAGR